MLENQYQPSATEEFIAIPPAARKSVWIAGGIPTVVFIGVLTSFVPIIAMQFSIANSLFRYILVFSVSFYLNVFALIFCARGVDLSGSMRLLFATILWPIGFFVLMPIYINLFLVLIAIIVFGFGETTWLVAMYATLIFWYVVGTLVLAGALRANYTSDVAGRL